MLKTRLSLLLVLIAVSASAYIPLVNPSNSWTFTTGGWFPLEGQQWFGNDTTIDVVTYRVLYSDYAISPQPVPDGLFREDIATEQVFRRSADGEDLLIFDFSIEAGDSVVVHPIGCDGGVTLHVTSTSTEMINGLSRKKIVFDEGETWYEGIGSEYTVMAPGHYICTSDWEPSVICFYEDGGLAWTNPEGEGGCSAVSIEEIDALSKLTLYPNPAVNHVSLIWNTPQIGAISMIEMIDAKGNIIVSQSTARNNITLDISQVSNGVYLVRISNSTGVIALERLIK